MGSPEVPGLYMPAGPASHRSQVFSELECYANDYEEIFIEISDGELNPQYVCLDVSTAIKLAKTLRTEINKIKEVNNG